MSACPKGLSGREAPGWPEPGWPEVEPFPFVGARKAFTGTGAVERIIPVRYYVRPADQRLIAVATFGPRVEGAPGQAHGGAVLTVFDEALGAAAWLEGHPVFTVRLNCEFRKSVPIPSELLVTTELYRVRSRLVFVRGEVLGRDGIRYARADAQFFRLDEETTRRLKGG
ncbi:MAG: PaaI family thioesterase [Elusimicrobia bacterium]|nr:PaaI family thioesterase [Elusimicrobiota bacterium]